MHSELLRSIRVLRDDLSDDRVNALDPIARWCAQRIAQGRPAHLMFVCSHNSRRSVLAQAWAIATAHEAGMSGLHFWSAGAEDARVAMPTIRELERAGFRVEDHGEETGEWILSIGEEEELLVSHSKTIADPENPADGYAAVLVCDAEACPLTPHAEARFPLTYADPKPSDGTPEETATYRDRSGTIATEMRWLMNRIRALG